MGITVQDIADIMIDSCNFKIYDVAIDDYIYDGWSDDIPEDIGYLEVQTIDVPDKRIAMVLNVDSEY